MTKDAAEISDAAAGTTAIYLARIGVGGSSGHHSQRRTMVELHAYSRALDALKERYKFEGFDLIGQSGGSTLIATMLAFRTDIRCAVLGSGLLAGKRRRPRGSEPFPAAFPPGRRCRRSSRRAARCADHRYHRAERRAPCREITRTPSSSRCGPPEGKCSSTMSG